jgi:hypothetical protein
MNLVGTSDRMTTLWWLRKVRTRSYGNTAMRKLALLGILTCGLATQPLCSAGVTNQYLFIGHPGSDWTGGEIMQREVERIDFTAYELLLLGGDYTLSGTGTRATVSYLDAVLDLAAPTTLAALGNHDTSHKDYFTDVTGRPRYYAFETNGITFVVLDTTDDSRNILGGELQMLTNTINAMPPNTQLVIVHHHIIWLADYPPLAHLQGSPLLAASSANLSGLNFHSTVYPLLLQARAKGVAVLCLAGDRTGSATQEFFIDHTTVDGVRFVAAGLQETLARSNRTVVVLEHDTAAGTLTCRFKHLTDLPRIPDEPLIINELHYDPPPTQGNDWSFIELFNRGAEPYDLSGATFSSGVVCTFPSNTIVAPGEYVIVAAEPSHYAGLGIQVFDYEGIAKPDSDDPMWLRDLRGLEIAYVAYGVTNPWPSLPDNQGPSLMLVAPDLDYTLASSWATSDQNGGTPGHQNIVPPQPGTLSFAGGLTTVPWHGVVSNAWYQLESTAMLTPPDWQPAGPVTQATADSIQLEDSNAMDPVQRFFRLSRLFP